MSSIVVYCLLTRSNLSDKSTLYGFESALSNLGPYFYLKGWHNIYSKYQHDHREFSSKHFWRISCWLHIFTKLLVLTFFKINKNKIVWNNFLKNCCSLQIRKISLSSFKWIFFCHSKSHKNSHSALENPTQLPLSLEQ